MEIILTELGCSVSMSTASEALGIALSRLSYDVQKGFDLFAEYEKKINVSGGYCKLETVAKFSISDRDKGLINAVREVFPELPHSKCLRHLSENFKKKFKQEMTDVLKCYALSYKPEDCTARLQVLKNHERGDEIVSWVEAAEPHLWVRSKW